MDFVLLIQSGSPESCSVTERPCVGRRLPGSASLRLEPSHIPVTRLVPLAAVGLPQMGSSPENCPWQTEPPGSWMGIPHPMTKGRRTPRGFGLKPGSLLGCLPPLILTFFKVPPLPHVLRKGHHAASIRKICRVTKNGLNPFFEFLISTKLNTCKNIYFCIIPKLAIIQRGAFAET